MTSSAAETILSSSGEELELSILMPCLNEAETLARCIRKARSFLEHSKVRGEVLVADNGSTDGSMDIAEAEGARVVPVSRRGYGAALYYGSLAARGKFIIMGDADDSYDFSDLDEFLARLREGYDLVMGNRFLGGIEEGAMPWKNRRIGNPLLSFIGRLLFNCPVGDFHSGLRAYSKRAFENLDLRTPGMEFASEMVIKATLQKQRMTEVPIRLHKDGRSRRPHLRPWRDGWRHLRFMFLFSPRWLFLYPGIVLFMISLGLTLRLLFSPLWIGRVELDVNTLLFSACGTLLGYQILSIALLAKSFAVNAGLLPENRMLKAFRSFFSLEAGLCLAALLFLCGLIYSGFAISQWANVGFGNLEVRSSLRLVTPAFLLMALGVQTAVLSFVLGLFELNGNE